MTFPGHIHCLHLSNDFCAGGWTLFLLVQSVGTCFVIGHIYCFFFCLEFSAQEVGLSSYWCNLLALVLSLYFLAIFTVCFCLGISAQEAGLASYWCYCRSSFCHCCTFPGHIHCLLLSWDLCAGCWTSYWSKLLSQFAFVLGFLRRRLDSLSFGAICWSYILSMWYISWSYSLFAFVLGFLRRHCDFEKKWILKNKRKPIYFELQQILVSNTSLSGILFYLRMKLLCIKFPSK